jgi:hypothetical protein
MMLDSCSRNGVTIGLGPSASIISGSGWIAVPDPKVEEEYIPDCNVGGKAASLAGLIVFTPINSLSSEVDKRLRGSEAKAGGVRISALDIVTK